MKNLSLFSLLVMIGMVLFLGGCQKDEEVVLKDKAFVNKQEHLDSIALQKFKLPNDAYFVKGTRSGEDVVSYDSLNKICDLILSQDSVHNFLLPFTQMFGFPQWLESFEIYENRGVHKIISIPFVKDSIVTGVLQYHSNFGKNGLIFLTREHIYSQLQNDFNSGNNLQLFGIYSYIKSQSSCFEKIDQTLITWIIDREDGNIRDSESNGNRNENCITYCSG